jgi:dTDP-4-dehydrorhamnose 3,5-epimerase
MEKQFKVLSFPEIAVFIPKKYFDNRGIFFENFNSLNFKKYTGMVFDVLQENISFSNKNVLRGLHFQKGQYAQSKLIHVIKGSILDVVVDIRPNSKNFGKWISYVLDDKNNESIFIPSGFAHGFLALEDCTKISYKVDNLYNNASECSIIWNDKKIMVDWPLNKPILSEKDNEALSFEKNYEINNF